MSLEPVAGWRAPWRLPYADRVLYPPELQPTFAAMPYGGRLAFRSDTTVLAGRVVPVDLDALVSADDPLHDRVRALLRPWLTASSAVDLYCDGESAGSADLLGRDGFRFDGLPPAPSGWSCGSPSSPPSACATWS